MNYSYLADGSKASSLKASGEGPVYRGPFTYRRLANGSLSLESVVCPEGRLTPDKALLYVTDHLGSIRAVIDGNTGSALEASDYSVYGLRSDASLSGGTLPIGPGHDFIGELVPGGEIGLGSSIATSITYRDHFTGQEDQLPDFGIPYSDHGARLYSHALRRWMTPDPLSEKYYGLSPYNYCGGNLVNAVDLDGKDIWKIDEAGHIVEYVKNPEIDIISVVTAGEDSKILNNESASVSLPAGSITQVQGLETLFQISNNDAAQQVFEMLALNTSVEWSLVTYKDDKAAEVGNNHSERSNKTMIDSVRGRENSLRSVIHSHPHEPYPSSKDKTFYDQLKLKSNDKMPVVQIFYVPKSVYIDYDGNGPIYKSTYYESF